MRDAFIIIFSFLLAMSITYYIDNKEPPLRYFFISYTANKENSYTVGNSYVISSEHLNRDDYTSFQELDGNCNPVIINLYEFKSKEDYENFIK